MAYKLKETLYCDYCESEIIYNNFISSNNTCKGDAGEININKSDSISGEDEVYCCRECAIDAGYVLLEEWEKYNKNVHERCINCGDWMDITDPSSPFERGFKNEYFCNIDCKTEFLEIGGFR